MRTRKTIRLLVLAAALLLALPVSALAEEKTGAIGENGAWSFNDGELSISGAADLSSFRPENELDFYREITWVSFGPEVTNIRADAFARCPVDGFSVAEENPHYLTVEGILYSKDETKLLGVPSAKTGTLDIPSQVTDIDMLAFSRCSFSSICVDGGNENYLSLDGVLFDRDKTILYCYPAGKGDSQYTLPGSVKLISAYAFATVKNLNEIFLFDSQNHDPANELTIDSNAFCESSLETVHFPSTLTRIGSSAFQYCSNLTSLTYQGYTSGWRDVEIGRHNTPLYLYSVACREDGNADPRPEEGKIGENVTFSLNHLTGELTVSGAGAWGSPAFEYEDAVRSVTLENGVTEIGDYAFSGCANLEEVSICSSLNRIGEHSFSGCYRLSTVEIPASVNAIGSGAFDECYSLDDIVYGGTKAEWTALMDSREDEWIAWVTVHCSDGTIEATEPLLRIDPITITDCPATVSLGEDFAVRVRRQEHVDSYIATLQGNDWEINAWGSNDGLIRFWDWPDDAAADTCTLTVSAYGTDENYIKYGTDAETAITVTDAARPAAPDMGIRVLMNGAEPTCWLIRTIYDLELSWNTQNVTAVRWKETPEEPFITSARRAVEENAGSFSNGIYWLEPGEVQIRASVCVNGTWSLWSDAATITVIDDTGLTPHTVTFEGNGGRGRMASQTVYEEMSLPLAANAFTRTGMYFDGWNTQANGNGTAYGDREAVSLTEDTTLYAQWKIKDIHFSVDVIDQTSGVHMIGGKVRLSGSYAVDNTKESLPPYEDCIGASNYGAEGDILLTLEAIPSDHYSFAGWYSGEVLNAYNQTLTPVELLSTDPILNLELTEHGFENCTMICAVYEYAPTFGKHDFQVPESLAVISESAFENIGAVTVYVPDTCTEIMSNAFRDCRQLRLIRLPKDCVIAKTVFDGCRTDPDSLDWDDENQRLEDCSDLLAILAPAGGTTQTWAETAEILFIAE